MNLERFNPSNKLSSEDVDALRNLSNEQIQELAKMYPNAPRGNGYLLLYNTKVKEDQQTFPLSTWRNLANLHKKLGQTYWKPWDFRSSVKTTKTPVVGVARGLRKVDLQPGDIAGAEGLKTGAVATASTEVTNPAPAAAETGAVSSEGATASTEVTNQAAATAEIGAVTESPELAAYNAAKEKLDQLVAQKAHPNSIKAAEKALAKAEEALKASEASDLA